MRTKIRMIPLASAAAIALVALGGCSHAFREPQVSLANVVAGGIGLKGGSVVAQIEVKNPNSFKLSTQSISYKFEVLDQSRSDTSWVPVTNGVVDKPISVGAGDKTIVEVPIDFNYSDFGAVQRSVRDRGSFKYRISGTVELKDPVRRTIPFRRQDTFSLATIH